MTSTIVTPGIQVGIEDSHGPVNFAHAHQGPDHDNVVFPDEHDYHGHPHYGRILVTLLALLGVSLAVGYFVSPGLAMVLIFGTALWKITLVMRNFMHLKFEPLLMFIVVAAVLIILYAFFFGVYPDITAIPRDVTFPH